MGSIGEYIGSIRGIYMVHRKHMGSIGEHMGSIGGIYGVHRGNVWGPL